MNGKEKGILKWFRIVPQDAAIPDDVIEKESQLLRAGVRPRCLESGAPPTFAHLGYTWKMNCAFMKSLQSTLHTGLHAINIFFNTFGITYGQ